MRKKASRFSLALICVACLAFTGCLGQTEGTNTNVEEKKEPEKIKIKDLSQAWDAILNKSTKEFIGGHPIDEAFLSFVTAKYGNSVIEEIASYAYFDTPEIWYQLTGKSIHVLWYDYCKETGIQNYSFDNTYLLDDNESTSPNEIVIDLAGDLTLAENVSTTVFMDQQINGIEDCFSQDLLDEMRSADLMIINNEFAFTDRGEALEGKAYTFRGNPSRVGLIKELGVDLVSLANNHVYDYGEIGLLDTLDTLEGDSIPYVGAGRNLNQAVTPVYFIVGGRKIAICAATQIERTFTYTKEATEDSPGVLKCLHPELFCQEIAMAKTNADYVIVYPHWGTEGNANYGTDQAALARKFVDAGADVVIGGHTHCLQTIEYMDDIPIYYSLGNYYFSVSAQSPADYNTGLAQIRIQPDGGIDCFFIPCLYSDGVTSLLNSEDKAFSDIINSLNKLSKTAVLDSHGHVTKQ
ncbi:MAG: CapA family protein [Pseudobutyrivibrio sp.]|nr:CapA family protein [Pseudobutyrivibrio sp.]